MTADFLQVILFNAVTIFFKLMEMLIFVRVILSWFPINKNGSIMKIMYTLTEPILQPIRNMINKSPLGGPGMMLDFSPIIALFFLQIVKTALVYIIAYL